VVENPSPDTYRVDLSGVTIDAPGPAVETSRVWLSVSATPATVIDGPGSRVPAVGGWGSVVLIGLMLLAGTIPLVRGARRLRPR
jgi:hypothetical protein